MNGYLGDSSTVAPGQYLTFATWNAYSNSRGHIHVTNASDLANGYDFDSGFLSHIGDIKTHLFAYKTQREVARRLPWYRGEVPNGHPKFSECSTAALNQDNDGKPVTKDLEYSQEDDEAIEDFIRSTVAVSNHPFEFCILMSRNKLLQLLLNRRLQDYTDFLFVIDNVAQSRNFSYEAIETRRSSRCEVKRVRNQGIEGCGFEHCPT